MTIILWLLGTDYHKSTDKKNIYYGVINADINHIIKKVFYTNGIEVGEEKLRFWISNNLFQYTSKSETSETSSA